jgi:glutamate 5-kinase
MKKRRWIVKLGTGILTRPDGRLDPAQFNQLCKQVTHLKKSGLEIALVTSGAIGAGMKILGFDKRPTVLSELQACATVGQIQLMTEYQKRLARGGLSGAQLLLTYWDLDSRNCFENARRTLDRLMTEKTLVPIINENDAISGEEIKVGDNDNLSAHVALMTRADRLVILSNVEGLLGADTKPIPLVKRVDTRILSLVKGTSSERSVGGMVTKIQAARLAASGGIETVIAHGRDPKILEKLAAGKKVGTLFKLPAEDDADELV